MMPAIGDVANDSAWERIMSVNLALVRRDVTSELPSAASRLPPS